MKIGYWLIFLPLLLTIIFALLIVIKLKDVEKKALNARKRQDEYRRQLELKKQLMAEDTEK